MKLRLALAGVGLLALGASANGAIVINEVLGSTTGTDSEFIELYNTGGSSIDIGDWQIELWDSDSGASFGGADDSSPHVVPTGTTLAAGGYYLMANPTFSSYYSATPDFALPANAIENSSYTMILKDSSLATINSIFVTDGGVGDAANDAGTLITPDLTVGPDGSFLPAGFYRVGDGGATTALLEFSPQPAPSATPGAMNLPEPATMALLGLGALAIVRRRR
jgi:predicted extracellular nuclease